MRYSMPPTSQLSRGSNRNLDVPFIRTAQVEPILLQQPELRMAGKRTVKGANRKVYTYDVYYDQIMRARSNDDRTLSDKIMVGEIIELDSRLWTVTAVEKGEPTEVAPIRTVADLDDPLPPIRRFAPPVKAPKVKTVKAPKITTEDSEPGLSRDEMTAHLRALAEAALGFKLPAKLNGAQLSAIRDFEASMIAEAAYAA